MADDTLTSYDEVPYSNNCFPLTHPDRLAAIAALYGLTSPAVANCRVLELGCGLGGNLIPMALGLPEGRFIGIDLSTRQIEAGRAAIDALGLPNIELRAMSIANVDAGLGTFDYVICHGVYSWVPQAIQEKIMAICAQNLRPNGVAYVSYNTYPGWHARGLVREILRYHVRQRVEAHDRVAAAREFLEELGQMVSDKESSYARILKKEDELLREAGDHYLFHEHLEDTNQPCYFHEFAGCAAAHGLLCFSEARDVDIVNLPPVAAQTLERWAANPIARQQYVDFLCNRTFRRTLLCHEQAAPASKPIPRPVAGLAIRSAARPLSERPDVASRAAEEFRGNAGALLSTNHPMIKAALVILFEVWPKTMSLEALWASVQARLVDCPELDTEMMSGGAQELSIALMRCFLSGLVGLHVHPARFARAPSERPMASPLARLQAAGGSNEVANFLHRTVQLDEFDRVVVSLLDGCDDRAGLLNRLTKLVADDLFTIYREDQPIRDLSVVRDLFSAALEPSLRRIAGHALLVDA